MSSAISFVYGALFGALIASWVARWLSEKRLETLSRTVATTIIEDMREWNTPNDYHIHDPENVRRFIDAYAKERGIG